MGEEVEFSEFQRFLRKAFLLLKIKSVFFLRSHKRGFIVKVQSNWKIFVKEAIISYPNKRFLTNTPIHP